MGPPRFRWVIFVRSLVAAQEHPPAQMFRFLGRYLLQHNQEVVFLEQRANPLTVRALRQRGAAALQELTRDWPDLRYHTVELRYGADLSEWLGRTLATADSALVELGVQPELAYWVGQLTRPHLQTFLLDLWPETPELDPFRKELDPASYTAVICHPRLVPCYQGSSPARRIQTLNDPPEKLVAALLGVILDIVIVGEESERNAPELRR